MTRSRTLLGAAAVLTLVCAVAASPAKAQFGGDTDMMTQFAPMLEMMKAKMGKKRFAKLMQTVGPMMSNMMDGDGGGFGGMMGGMAGGSFGGGDIMGMMNNPQMIGMLPQLIGMIDIGERRRKRRR